ncbi:unnamed protein product [Bursaphelenchus okinawaensis]|uniref:DUF148 domain-containing protein n=1 Tax=Bursaphelenchus okinawaensis TaxID=465554 RepID=A0A811KSH3_9BILA|nr:unnamed protein product [Bursaphelenchus okinawaensis]CAG9110375.1 unnamed protein product [Bursaphelenchus okinawaensis]
MYISVLLLLSTFIFTYNTAVLSPFKDAIEGIPDSDKEQINAILMNPNATKGEIKDTIDGIVNNLPNQTLIDEIKNQRKVLQQTYETELQQRLANASADAKALNDQVQALRNNDSLTRQATCETIQDLVKNASKSVQNELGLKPHPCTFASKGLGQQQYPDAFSRRPFSHPPGFTRASRIPNFSNGISLAANGLLEPSTPSLPVLGQAASTSPPLGQSTLAFPDLVQSSPGILPLGLSTPLPSELSTFNAIGMVSEPSSLGSEVLKRKTSGAPGLPGISVSPALPSLSSHLPPLGLELSTPPPVGLGLSTPPPVGLGLSTPSPIGLGLSTPEANIGLLLSSAATPTTGSSEIAVSNPFEILGSTTAE